MNERIKLLAEQAVEETQLLMIMEYKNFESKLYEKFAELVVRECMEQVWYTREDGINGNVSEVIKDRIKQHFGVEE